MTSRSRASPGRFVAAFVVALAGHALLVWALVTFDLLGPLGRAGAKTLVASTPAGAAAERAASEADRPIEIEQLVDDLRRADEPTPAEKRADEQRKREEEDAHAHGQVVDLERPVLEQRPDKSDYLAEYDSSVARETRGKAGHDQPGGQRATPGGATAHPPSVPSLPSGDPSARPGLPGRRGGARLPSEARGQDGAAEELGTDGTLARPGAPRVPGAAPGLRLGEDGVPGTPGVPHPALQPTEEMLDRAIARGSGSPDYLRDIDDGESTALNAKKFKFASFFNRVKHAVADQWHPDVVYVRHDPSGNVYGTKDRVTVVRVHLHPDGALKDITLLESSGVEFLDEEGRDAFRRAQPFPNPPPQLVEADGLIHFNFGFIFELSGKTSFRVLRY